MLPALKPGESLRWRATRSCGILHAHGYDQSAKPPPGPLICPAPDIVRFLFLGVRSAVALRAENLFLRRQLALFAERKVKTRGADDGTRFVFVLLSRVFAWKDALVIVRPETLIRWHSEGISPLLALEEQEARSAAAADGNSTGDCANGRTKRNLGRRAHRRGASLKTGRSGVTAHGEAIYASRRRDWESGPITTVDNLRQKSREGHCGLRLFRDSHGNLPDAICPRHHGGGHPTDNPF